MDSKKQIADIADKALEEAGKTATRGVNFLKASLLRSLVLLGLLTALSILILQWWNLVSVIGNGENFDVFITTMMVMMSTPLTLIALYFYSQSFFRLLGKYSRLTVADRKQHRKELLIACFTASAAGWALKLFFIPLVIFMFITLYIFKLLPVPKED